VATPHLLQKPLAIGRGAWAQKLMYIKLPIYLYIYMALGLNDFDAGKSITHAIKRGGVGPEISTFLGPKWHKIIPSRVISTTDTYLLYIAL
jgi:hypothetical protein